MVTRGRSPWLPGGSHHGYKGEVTRVTRVMSPGEVTFVGNQGNRGGNQGNREGNQGNRGGNQGNRGRVTRLTGEVTRVTGEVTRVTGEVTRGGSNALGSSHKCIDSG